MKCKKNSEINCLDCIVFNSIDFRLSICWIFSFFQKDLFKKEKILLLHFLIKKIFFFFYLPLKSFINNFFILGVCDGDNSTCTCVIYHGYHINELDYILLQEAINETLLSVDCLIDLLDAILVKLQCLDVDHLDIASVIKIICMFMRKNLEPYSDNLDDLIAELDKSFGLPSDFQSFLNTQTNDNFYKWIDSVTNY